MIYNNQYLSFYYFQLSMFTYSNSFLLRHIVMSPSQKLLIFERGLKLQKSHILVRLEHVHTTLAWFTHLWLCFIWACYKQRRHTVETHHSTHTHISQCCAGLASTRASLSTLSSAFALIACDRISRTALGIFLMNAYIITHHYNSSHCKKSLTECTNVDLRCSQIFHEFLDDSLQNKQYYSSGALQPR